MPNLPWPKKTVASVTLLGAAFNASIVNVFHFEASQVLETTFTNDAQRISAVTALVNDWETNLKDEWAQCHVADYSLQMVRGQVLEVPNVFRHRLTPYEKTVTAGGSGTVADTCDNLTTAAVIKWRTPQAGKSHRGRSYIGPIANSWMTDGRLSGVGPTRLQVLIDGMLTRYGPAGIPVDLWAMTVYSRPYNSGEYQYATRKTGSLTVVTPPDYAGNSTNITSGSVDAVLRVQRRRELGVGS